MSKQIKIIEPQRKQLIQNNSKKQKVCAYRRVSTDSTKQHTSYLSQAEYYENYIKENDEWEFVEIFADESSGTKLKSRDGFNQMIKACEQGEIDLIITKSVTRFSRNTVDSIKTVRYLKTLGVAVYFEKENINTLLEQSEQMLTILSSIAQGESENISSNTRWGIQKRFSDGTYIPSCVAYGYIKNEDGQLIIHEEQCVIIKRIFAEYLNGKGGYLIAKELNNDNIATIRNAKKWTDTVVKEILQNPIYEGKMLLQKTYTTQTLPFTKYKNKGEFGQYLIENSHPAIISADTADKVKTIMKYRSQQIAKEQSQNKYEFSGKIKCTVCGGTFRRQKICIATNYEKVQWCCKTHIFDKNNCSQKAIKETELQTAFISMYNRLASNFEEILYPLLTALKELSLQENSIKILEINNKITEINEQSHILSRVMVKGYLDSALYISQQTSLNIQLENLKKDKNMLIQNTDFEKEISATNKIIQIVKNNYYLQIEYRKDLLDAMLEEIFISDNEIIFKLINGLNLTESRCDNAKQNSTRI